MTQVGVFPTCLAELVSPAVTTATLNVLRSRGHEASRVRGATCCGQPAWNAGYTSEARRVARRTLRALRRGTGPVVVPSGSCATMMKEHWPHLFAGTRHEAATAAAAGRVEELSDFLAGSDEGTPVVVRPTDASRRVAYHDSCHMLRELGIRDQPRRLLAAHGVEVVEQEGAEQCCGFGGTFSVKLPDVSVAMADAKLDAVAATGVRELVGCDVSCLMHLGGRAQRRGMDLTTRHLAEVLDS